MALPELHCTTTGLRCNQIKTVETEDYGANAVAVALRCLHAATRANVADPQALKACPLETQGGTR